MNYSYYRNYTTYGSSYISATIRSSDRKYTTHDSDDAATVSMEIHILMNWINCKISLVTNFDSMVGCKFSATVCDIQNISA
jgi:hypothetical protein